ncbi:hypothetical protein GEMRC1_003476 [Eukaryota sp. GEM-RC1]
MAKPLSQHQVLQLVNFVQVIEREIQISAEISMTLNQDAFYVTSVKSLPQIILPIAESSSESDHVFLRVSDRRVYPLLASFLCDCYPNDLYYLGSRLYLKFSGELENSKNLSESFSNGLSSDMLRNPSVLKFFKKLSKTRFSKTFPEPTKPGQLNSLDPINDYKVIIDYLNTRVFDSSHDFSHILKFLKSSFVSEVIPLLQDRVFTHLLRANILFNEFESWWMDFADLKKNQNDLTINQTQLTDDLDTSVKMSEIKQIRDKIFNGATITVSEFSSRFFHDDGIQRPLKELIDSHLDDDVIDFLEKEVLSLDDLSKSFSQALCEGSDDDVSADISNFIKYFGCLCTSGIELSYSDVLRFLFVKPITIDTTKLKLHETIDEFCKLVGFYSMFSGRVTKKCSELLLELRMYLQYRHHFTAIFKFIMAKFKCLCDEYKQEFNLPDSNFPSLAFLHLDEYHSLCQSNGFSIDELNTSLITSLSKFARDSDLYPPKLVSSLGKVLVK